MARWRWVEAIMGSPEDFLEPGRDQLTPGEYVRGGISDDEVAHVKYITGHQACVAINPEMEAMDRKALRLQLGSLLVAGLLPFLSWSILGQGAFMPTLVVAMLGLGVGVPTGAMIHLLRKQRRRLLEEGEKKANEQALALMREKLAGDPLDWPAWTLGDAYPILNAPVRKALREVAGEIEFEAVRADALTLPDDLAQTPVRELLEEVRARGVARVDAVVLRVPVFAGANSTASCTDRHRELSESYAAYLSDPREILIRPALNDVTDPVTAEFIEAYARLTALAPESAAYEEALTRAWKSWRAAEAHSRKVGIRGLSRDDRRRVTTARKLLALALDPASTDSERASAYAQVGKLVEGLVELPEEARLSITRSVRSLGVA